MPQNQVKYAYTEKQKRFLINQLDRTGAVVVESRNSHPLCIMFVCEKWSFLPTIDFIAVDYLEIRFKKWV